MDARNVRKEFKIKLGFVCIITNPNTITKTKIYNLYKKMTRPIPCGVSFRSYQTNKTKFPWQNDPKVFFNHAMTVSVF